MELNLLIAKKRFCRKLILGSFSITSLVLFWCLWYRWRK